MFKKEFTHRAGWNHFWKPVLNDVVRIENLFYRLSRRYEKRCEEIQNIKEEVINSTAPWNGGMGYIYHSVFANPTLDIDKNHYKWYRYDFKVNDEYENGYSVVSEKIYDSEYNMGPKDPSIQSERLNHLGQKMYSLSRCGDKFLTRLHSLLSDSIKLYLSKKSPLRIMEVSELTINNRKYNFELGPLGFPLMIIIRSYNI